MFEIRRMLSFTSLPPFLFPVLCEYCCRVIWEDAPIQCDAIMLSLEAESWTWYGLTVALILVRLYALPLSSDPVACGTSKARG